MDRLTRYAIYYLPEPDEPLWTYGSSILGYDAINGTEREPIAFPGILADELSACTAQQRIYGFHATLKAPFRLTPGTGEIDLLETASAFAAEQEPVTIGRLAVKRIGQFVALVPDFQQPELTAIAAACVTRFDHLRAPLSEEERTGRLQAGLNARETELLNRWGYPYVLEGFQFHMTLAGPMAIEKAEEIATLLAAVYESISAPQELRSICVCAQIAGGPFRMIRRFRFGAQNAERTG